LRPAYSIRNLPFPSLVHPDDLITPTEPPSIIATHADNISVSSVETPPISDGTAPYTPAGLVIKLHQDMHQGHVEDPPTIMGSMVIMTLRENMRETSLKSAD
jgi:hypothetical protein